MTPEQIVADWFASYDPERHIGLSPLDLTVQIRAYGDERARQERERCAEIAWAHRSDITGGLFGMAHDAQTDTAEDIADAIRALA